MSARIRAADSVTAGRGPRAGAVDAVFAAPGVRDPTGDVRGTADLDAGAADAGLGWIGDAAGALAAGWVGLTLAVRNCSMMGSTKSRGALTIATGDRSVAGAVGCMTGTGPSPMTSRAPAVGVGRRRVDCVGTTSIAARASRISRLHEYARDVGSFMS